MAKNRDIPKTSIKTPWLTAHQPALERVVATLVAELIKKHEEEAQAYRLSPREKIHLEREFKNSEQGRAHVYKFLSALARKIKVTNPEAIFIAPMKDFDRAARKSHVPDRNLHDLGRARLRVRTIKQVSDFYKTMSSKDSDDHIPGTPARTYIMPGTYDDYLKKSRKSGYAGSINFDVEVDIGKGRWGTLEVQIMPWDYEDVYERSHSLFDFIRIYQEIPVGFLSKHQEDVLSGLLIANAALFDEQALRTGFDELRTQPIRRLSSEDANLAWDVLELVRNHLESSPASHMPWAKAIADACTYAKSSVGNMERARHLGNAAPSTVPAADKS